MKAVQINGYSKQIHTVLRDIPLPPISDSEVLIQVRAAAVNPLELLILTGRVKLIQDYAMPLTLGNECSGIVEAVGSKVTGFQKGDRVYTRLPLNKIGAFAEYVAVDQNAIAKMPEGYDFSTAAAIPLTGLTAYQAMVEELEAKPGETLLIPGGSGSFGQMAVPIAKAMGLRVIVTGNPRAKERFCSMGVERYMDYQRENYWEQLSGVDYVIDTLGGRRIGARIGGPETRRATGEPAGRPQQSLCCKTPCFRAEKAAVHSGRQQIRQGCRKAGQGVPIPVCPLQRAAAEKDHRDCGAAADQACR